MDTQHIAPAAHSTADETTWRTRYTAERRKARVLGATTVAASLLAVALGAWGLSNAGGAGTTGVGGPGIGQPGQFGPPGTGQRSTGGSAQAPMGQDPAAMLFNTDGSVNTQLLEEFLSRMPDGGLEQFLRVAVTNGELTQQQADAVSQAAGAQDT